MNVLVLNVGSSTLKFELIRTDPERMSRDEDRRLARGVVERIGGEAVLELRADEGEPRMEATALADIQEAVNWILRWIASPDSGVEVGSVGEIDAVGHRVVHGGAVLPLRDPVFPLSAPQDPPLWIPRNVPPLCGVALPQAPGSCP